MKAFIRKILAATAFTIGTVGIAFGANPTLSDIDATYQAAATNSLSFC